MEKTVFVFVSSQDSLSSSNNTNYYYYQQNKHLLHGFLVRRARFIEITTLQERLDKNTLHNTKQ